MSKIKKLQNSLCQCSCPDAHYTGDPVICMYCFGLKGKIGGIKGLPLAPVARVENPIVDTNNYPEGEEPL